MRAFASIVFGDSFKVTNVAVIGGSRGTFVSMPGFCTKERDEHNNPVYKDVCNPITKEKAGLFVREYNRPAGTLFPACRIVRILH